MKRLISILTALLLVAQLPLSVLAVEVDLSYGDVSITDNDVTHSTATETNKTEAHEGSVTVTQSNSETATSNTITVTTETKDVTVTLENVNIDVSDTGGMNNHLPTAGEAAVSVDRAEDTTVTVELEGTNNLSSGMLHAGLEVSGDGELVINGDGALNTKGGDYGAGIGGGLNINWETQQYESDGNNITIESGTINAEGGINAAGIGAGSGGSANNITIKDGTITAQGGSMGAGIGTGSCNGFDASANNITIEGGTVNAQGGSCGAGIGGGEYGSSSNIIIIDGTVNAEGTDGGAGIGGGFYGGSSEVIISGGTVNATSTSDGTITGGAGIGGGKYGTAEEIVLKEDANVTATGSGNGADIGDGKVTGSEEKQENKVDISELSPSGSFTGSDGEKIEGEYVPVQPTPDPEPETKPEPPAPSYEEEEEEEKTHVSGGGSTNGYKKGSVWSNGYISKTLFKVENGAGMKPEWEEECEDGILTITAENEPVIFTSWLNGLKYLQEKLGISTILIKTADCETELVIADLLALNGSEYILTQEGETATLTVDGKTVEMK